jgi:hypothetical protein
VIYRWPSASPHFSFHCWLRLNHELQPSLYDGHRQIYALHSDSIDLQAFVYSRALVVAINDPHEFVYTEIKDCDDLLDGHWHSLTIVHSVQRSSRFVSAFQTSITCRLSVYIDGCLRRDIKDFKYGSLLNESIRTTSIGLAHQPTKLSTTQVKAESLSSTLTKSIQPLADLFSSRTKHVVVKKDNAAGHVQQTIASDADAREILFGSSNCLNGQIGSVWLCTEPFDETQVKHLHSLGKLVRLS